LVRLANELFGSPSNGLFGSPCGILA